MDVLADAATALRQARHVVVLSGAGISAESGIPTLRDQLTGLWARHDPQRLETAKAFRENPPLVWGWYLWRRQQVLQAAPNAAHRAIVHLAGSGRKVSVITQNIDDLHERAGSQDVVHLHGSLIIPSVLPATVPPSSLPLRSPSPRKASWSNHRAVATAMAGCDRVSCGSAKICRREPGKPPRKRRVSATCCCRLAPPAWSCQPPACPTSPWRQAPWSSTSTRSTSAWTSPKN